MPSGIDRQDFQFHADSGMLYGPDSFKSMVESSSIYYNATTITGEFPDDDLSDAQEIALSLLCVFSATLSLLGSSTIVYKILKNHSKTQSTPPYDRIMLGLSTCDIVASLTYAMSPFLLPSDTSTRVWAMGNETTCTGLGFLTQISTFWAIWYNCVLSFYYLLTVRFRVKRKEFCQKYELWFHLSGAIFFPVTAFLGFFGDWYSEMELATTCWIGEVPKGCTADGTCTGAGQLIAYIFAGIPIGLTIVALLVNNIMIYVYVRKTLSGVSQAVVVAPDVASSPTKSKSTKSKSIVSKETFHTKLIRIQEEKGCTSDDEEIGSDIDSRSVEQITPEESIVGSSVMNVDVKSSIEQDTLARSIVGSSILDNDNDSVANNQGSPTGHRRSTVTREEQMIREVATQGFLYVTTFLLAFTPAFVIQVLDSTGYGVADQAALYPLLVANNILLPLQGFFNVFVYTLPTYRRFSTANPDRSWCYNLKHALFDPNIPRMRSAVTTVVGGHRTNN